MFPAVPSESSISLVSMSLLAAAVVFLPMVFSLPQSAPPSPPNIASLSMYGTGCPIGAGGLISTIRNETPVFTFAQWGLSLPSSSSPSDTAVSKFCTEEIGLTNGPVGMQLRIETVTVMGWADLEEGTKLVVDSLTRLGGVVAGNGSVAIEKKDLEGKNELEVSVDIRPPIYSPCVGASGDVPKILIRTSVGLVGETRADGTVSKGVVGGEKKVLGVHFDPVWRPCS
ncbi:hypothetical protein QBC44DRAFT_269361, partial [Cladorrhinum sp. PSN332]